MVPLTLRYNFNPNNELGILHKITRRLAKKKQQPGLQRRPKTAGATSWVRGFGTLEHNGAKFVENTSRMEISICNSFWTAWSHKGKLLSKFAVAVVISTEGWNKDAQREAHPIVPEYHELPTTIVAMEYFAALLLSDWSSLWEDHWVLPAGFNNQTWYPFFFKRLREIL